MAATDILEKILTIIQQPSFIYINHVEIKTDYMFEAMKLLEVTNKITASQMAHSLNIPSPIVTQIIKNLELIGAVKKVKAVRDARVTLIELTEYGKESIKKHEMASMTIKENILRGFTEEELQTFDEYLKRIEKNIANKDLIEQVSAISSNHKNWECFGRISVKLGKICNRMMGGTMY